MKLFLCKGEILKIKKLLIRYQWLFVIFLNTHSLAFLFLDQDRDRFEELADNVVVGNIKADISVVF